MKAFLAIYDPYYFRNEYFLLNGSICVSSLYWDETNSWEGCIRKRINSAKLNMWTHPLKLPLVNKGAAEIIFAVCVADVLM